MHVSVLNAHDCVFLTRCSTQSRVQEYQEKQSVFTAVMTVDNCLIQSVKCGILWRIYFILKGSD